MNELKPFEQAISDFQKLTNLTKKTSQKILTDALFKREKIDALIKIIELLNNFNICDQCGLIRTQNNCLNCENSNKEIFLIENVYDYFFFKEKQSSEKYFSINFFDKKDYADFEKINLFIDRLQIFINNNNIKKIIILFSPSFKYEIISSVLKTKINKNIIILKMGVGVSFDSNIQYFDSETLKASIKNSEKI